jgi:UTP--glucose-1-phosphate uridylyltransferase
MNSFNTDQETSRIIQKYKGSSLDIFTFNQSRFPRIEKDSLMPMPSDPNGSPADWYPPGHGDLFEALQNSGTLDHLLAMGKEYIFVSNIDNLGATVDKGTFILNPSYVQLFLDTWLKRVLNS